MSIRSFDHMVMKLYATPYGQEIQAERRTANSCQKIVTKPYYCFSKITTAQYKISYGSPRQQEKRSARWSCLTSAAWCSSAYRTGSVPKVFSPHFPTLVDRPCVGILRTSVCVFLRIIDLLMDLKRIWMTFDWIRLIVSLVELFCEHIECFSLLLISKRRA